MLGSTRSLQFRAETIEARALGTQVLTPDARSAIGIDASEWAAESLTLPAGAGHEKADRVLECRGLRRATGRLRGATLRGYHRPTRRRCRTQWPTTQAGPC